MIAQLSHLVPDLPNPLLPVSPQVDHHFQAAQVKSVKKRKSIITLSDERRKQQRSGWDNNASHLKPHRLEFTNRFRVNFKAMA